MRDINTQNLLFLLTAAPLGVGCVITDGDDETTTSTTSATDATATTTATGDGSTGGSGGSGDGTTGGDTTTTTTTATETTMDGGSSTTEDTGEGVVECINYGDTIEYCYDADAGTAAEEYCVEVLMGYADYSPECEAAGLAYFACLSALSCDDLIQTPIDELCVEEQAALDADCGA